MSITNSQRDKLNKMNRASQDVSLGTLLQGLESTSGSLGSMAFQSASAVNITGGEISNTLFSGSIVDLNSPGLGQVLSFNNGLEWIDNSVAGGLVLKGDWNAATNTPDLVSGSPSIPVGNAWVVSVAGSTVLGGLNHWEVNDWAVRTDTSWIEIAAATTLIWGNINGSIVNQTDLQLELDDKEDVANKSSGSPLGTSDTLYPTQNAVKSYVDSHTSLSGSDVHGLGTMSTQSASAVAITGGTITPLTTHANLSGSNVHGLGTISTQSASAVNISGSLTGAASLNVLKTGDTMSGSLVVSASSAGIALSVTQTGSGSAVKFGDATNYTLFEKTGFMVMSGSAKVWDDARVPVTATNIGSANAPDFTVFRTNGAGSQGVYTYWFSATAEEELFFHLQMSHSWDGTDIHPHVHWVPLTTADGAPANQKVVWGLEYTWVEIGQIFGNTTIITSTSHVPADANVVAGKHYLTEFDPIASGSMTDAVSSMLVCRVFRNATAPADNYENDAGLLEIDFHYSMDTIGSRSELAK